jgi:hypothetical protein
MEDKMLDLNKFFVEVHDNSDKHGWWETERSVGEILSLIHSEWSEALEEYRAGRPNVWHKCEAPIEYGSCCENGGGVCSKPVCEYALGKDFMNPKPEGVAVELIDGVIRIFDFIGAIGGHLNNESTIDELLEHMEDDRKADCKTPLPVFVCILHFITSEAFKQPDVENTGAVLMTVAAMVMYWVRENGLDPEKLMLEKHEYNKGRPYKHGNKVC